MSAESRARRWRHRLEYVGLALLLAVLRWLPRRWARAAGAGLGRLGYWFHRRWREVGRINLRLAFPERSQAERERILRASFRHLGWTLAEFARLPRYTARNIEEIIVCDGLEHYQQGAAGGKGVLFLTAHLGAWELSSFAHSLRGYPLAYVNRPLDNPWLDRLINRYRCLGGNVAIDRRHAARTILDRLRQRGDVGALMDQNVVEGDGNVFVDFFGVAASTTAGPARLALHSGAAVVPGFALWDQERGKYRLRFQPPLEVVRTGEAERDVAENTARFNQVIEETIRRYPEQWLWIHRRWSTRPPGEPPIYPT